MRERSVRAATHLLHGLTLPRRGRERVRSSRMPNAPVFCWSVTHHALAANRRVAAVSLVLPRSIRRFQAAFTYVNGLPPGGVVQFRWQKVNEGHLIRRQLDRRTESAWLG